MNLHVFDNLSTLIYGPTQYENYLWTYDLNIFQRNNNRLFFDDNDYG